MQKRLNILALTAGVSLVSVSSHAQLLASESFNYSTGAGVIGTAGSAGNGWLAAWNSKTDGSTQNQIASGSLSYSTLTTSGNSLISSTATTTTAQPERAFSSTFGAFAAANTAAAGTLWMSYLWQGLNTTGSGVGIYRQSIMMFLTGATTATGSGTERLDVGMPNISTVTAITNNPNISLWTSGGTLPNIYSSTGPEQSTVAANNGATDFILMKFTVDNVTTTADTVSIWINPTLNGSAPVGAPDLSYSSQDFSALNGIRIQTAGTNSVDGFGGQQVDEINLGDTVADVEPGAVTVPEPTSVALVGLGALTWLRLKRK